MLDGRCFRLCRGASFLRASCCGRPGLALVDLSVVEQRYRAVLAGGSVTQVAGEVGVARQTLSGWVSRYRESGLAGLVDRSRRPLSSPSQMSAEVETLVCELRRYGAEMACCSTAIRSRPRSVRGWYVIMGIRLPPAAFGGTPQKRKRPAFLQVSACITS
ncbi:helix-turn-helix domain-containing protein [Nonomuraea sp. NPDC003727]